MTRKIHDIEVPAGSPAAVAVWLIDDAVSHPIWNQYVCTIVSLEDMPGVKPAIKHRGDVTHEILLYALSPEHPATPETAIDDYHLLSPGNHGYQFKSESDEAAKERGLKVLTDAPSLDTDFRLWWDLSFNDAYSLKRRAAA